MKKLREYADEAAGFVSPYIESAGDYIGSVKDKASDMYTRRKKRIERENRILRIKRFFDGVVGTILIIAAAIAAALAIFGLVQKFVLKRGSTSKVKFKSDPSQFSYKEPSSDAAADADTAEQEEDAESNLSFEEEVEKIHQKNGYITL